MAEMFSITLNIPALDRLVNWLETNHETAVTPAPMATVTSAVVCDEIRQSNSGQPTAKEEPKPKKAKKTEEKVAETPKVEEPTPEEEVVDGTVCVQEEATVNYTYEQLASCAMALRDADPNNMAKIRALFPEFGIRTLNALKDDQNGINAFAAKLIEIGGVM